MAEATAASRPAPALRRMLIPLALAQFICSFAGSNMNVMINDISKDLNTTVEGVQTCITLFLLVMAALMIPGGKLTDRWGRKRCFTIGLIIYGIGALLSAAAPGLGVLILGNSILEGVGTALLIPPVYILTTMLFTDVTSRARAFGLISGMGGIGAAMGPLIGGVITTAISWRGAFVFQAAIIAVIGSSSVAPGFLQVARGSTAAAPGVSVAAAALGSWLSSLAQARLARMFRQRTLIVTGFVATIAGIGVLLAMVNEADSSAWAFAPGLLLIGLGLGCMLTPSVNIVQSAFPDAQQGEISGLSRSVSNLGSCLGTAIAGTILVSTLTEHAYRASMIVLAAIGLVGLVAALFLPADAVQSV